MTVLVFGASGQVATELQRQFDLLALGRDAADLLNPEGCAERILATRPEWVINAAAYTAVDRAESEEQVAHIVNALAPKAMAEACAKIDAPFIQISTDYVFDGSGAVPFKPTASTSPINAYGRTKLSGEQGVAAAGGRAAILRTSWVVSSHGSNFVKTMLRLSETRDALNIVGDQIGGPTPAADIARTVVEMGAQLAEGRGAPGVYHYAGKPSVSWAEFAAEIFSQAGRHVDVEAIPSSDYPTPARRPQNSRLDCSTLEDVFGIMSPDWRIGLSQILKDLEING